METKNQVMIVGFVGSPALLSRTESGSPSSKVSLATHNRNEDGKVNTTWTTITSYGAVAERIARLGAGDLVEVTARLRNTKWEQNGEQRQRVDVIGFYVQHVPRGSCSTSNQVEVTGCVAAEPVLDFTADGQMRARFEVVTHHTPPTLDTNTTVVERHAIMVVCVGAAAERVADAEVGDCVHVSGSVDTTAMQRPDGRWHRVTEVFGHRVTLGADETSHDIPGVMPTAELPELLQHGSDEFSNTYAPEVVTPPPTAPARRPRKVRTAYN